MNCGMQVFPHEYKCAYKSSYPSSSKYAHDAFDWEDYDAKYGYGWEDYRDYCAHRQSMEPTIPKASEYITARQFIEDVVCWNCESYFPDDVYPYIASDLETFGVSEDEFLEIAAPLWEFYSYRDF